MKYVGHRACVAAYGGNLPAGAVRGRESRRPRQVSRLRWDPRFGPAQLVEHVYHQSAARDDATNRHQRRFRRSSAPARLAPGKSRPMFGRRVPTSASASTSATTAGLGAGSKRGDDHWHVHRASRQAFLATSSGQARRIAGKTLHPSSARIAELARLAGFKRPPRVLVAIAQPGQPLR